MTLHRPCQCSFAHAFASVLEYFIEFFLRCYGLTRRCGQWNNIDNLSIIEFFANASASAARRSIGGKASGD
jgi:hypothetical protein